MGAEVVKFGMMGLMADKPLKTFIAKAYQTVYGVAGAPAITPEELKAKLDAKEGVVILDVREPDEHAISRIEGSVLIPLGHLAARSGELNKDSEIVALCKMGGRSARAVDYLKRQGFFKVRNLEGGIDAWAERIDPALPRS